MKSRFRKLTVESLEGRSVLSTTAFADFNHDGRVDVAAITDRNTIEVRLANPDGSYHVSDILSSPQNQPLQYVGVQDIDADGDLDIEAGGTKNSGSGYGSLWLNNGDGTFQYVEPFRFKHAKWFT